MQRGMREQAGREDTRGDERGEKNSARRPRLRALTACRTRTFRDRVDDPRPQASAQAGKPRARPRRPQCRSANALRRPRARRNRSSSRGRTWSQPTPRWTPARLTSPGGPPRAALRDRGGAYGAGRGARQRWPQSCAGTPPATRPAAPPPPAFCRHVAAFAPPSDAIAQVAGRHSPSVPRCPCSHPIHGRDPRLPARKKMAGPRTLADHTSRFRVGCRTCCVRATQGCPPSMQSSPPRGVPQ
jgi:hypothetical protein